MTLHAQSSPRGLWDGEVVKTADESVSASTTLQNDDHLFFDVKASVPYQFELLLLYSGTAAGSGTADLKHDFALSAGSVTRAWRQHVGWGPTTVIIQTGAVGDLSTVIQCGVSGAVESLFQFLVGYVLPSADATLNFRWAQNVSDAAAVVVKAGSVLRYKAVSI